MNIMINRALADKLPEYVTREMAAELLSVSVRQIDRMREPGPNGELPLLRTYRTMGGTGRGVRLAKQELLACEPAEARSA